jgi:UDP-glucose 4-epimerase
MKNILVTGGSGFIGSHLVNRLREEGYTVWNYDTQIQPDKDFKDIDVYDLAEYNIDTVFHLAADTDIENSIDYPTQHFNRNVIYTMEFINQCVIYRGIKKFVFASSASVYGSNEECEENSKCYPQNPYAAGKLTIENHLHAYAMSYGLPYMALRYFNVYGKNQKKGVIAKLKDCIDNDKPFVMYNGGANVRDFVHVNDVVRATILAGQSKWSNCVLNVGTGKGYKIEEIVKMVQAISGKTIDVVKRERESDIGTSVANTNLLKRTLNYVPPLDISPGLHTVFREQ